VKVGSLVRYRGELQGFQPDYSIKHSGIVVSTFHGGLMVYWFRPRSYTTYCNPDFLEVLKENKKSS